MKKRQRKKNEMKEFDKQMEIAWKIAKRDRDILLSKLA